MRIIIINPETQTVEEAEIENHFEAMQKVVGGLIQRAHEFTPTEEVYVNEEGLFGDMTYWFHIKGAHQPFVGTGFIVGHNPKTGDSVSTKMTVDEARRLISFLDKNTGSVYLAID
jgi:hypothetical protein